MGRSLEKVAIYAVAVQGDSQSLILICWRVNSRCLHGGPPFPETDICHRARGLHRVEPIWADVHYCEAGGPRAPLTRLARTLCLPHVKGTVSSFLLCAGRKLGGQDAGPLQNLSPKRQRTRVFPYKLVWSGIPHLVIWEGSHMAVLWVL